MKNPCEGNTHEPWRRIFHMQLQPLPHRMPQGFGHGNIMEKTAVAKGEIACEKEGNCMIMGNIYE